MGKINEHMLLFLLNEARDALEQVCHKSVVDAAWDYAKVPDAAMDQAGDALDMINRVMRGEEAGEVRK